MSNIIPVRKVVVSSDGSEFDSPAAFARHEYQTAKGVARTRVKIKRAGEGLVRAPDYDEEL